MLTPLSLELVPMHLYHPNIMNPSPTKHALAKVLPTYLILRSLPLLPIATNFQIISSRSGPFPPTTQAEEKSGASPNPPPPLVQEGLGKSYPNKLGYLCQGVGKIPDDTTQCVEGTDTFHVIRYRDVPTAATKK